MVTIKTLPIKIDDCTVTFQRLKVMTASRSKPNSILLVTSNPSPVARPANNGPAPGNESNLICQGPNQSNGSSVLKLSAPARFEKVL